MKDKLRQKLIQQNILDKETKNLNMLVKQLSAQHDALDRGFGGNDLSEVIKATNKAIALCNYRLTNSFEFLETINLELFEYYKDPSPYCHHCNADLKENCECLEYADNN